MYKIDFSNPSSIYFVGIGGISMSALAELLADAGFPTRPAAPRLPLWKPRASPFSTDIEPKILPTISTA